MRQRGVHLGGRVGTSGRAPRQGPAPLRACCVVRSPLAHVNTSAPVRRATSARSFAKLRAHGRPPRAPRWPRSPRPPRACPSRSWMMPVLPAQTRRAGLPQVTAFPPRGHAHVEPCVPQLLSASSSLVDVRHAAIVARTGTGRAASDLLPRTPGTGATGGLDWRRRPVAYIDRAVRRAPREPAPVRTGPPQRAERVRRRPVTLCGSCRRREDA
ncbi:hypothetical protein QJS66_18460 [Kocuria rhizophila]|nr:hypothetical protein QJS66_18460 [Kocuria rhizophila]